MRPYRDVDVPEGRRDSEGTNDMSEHVLKAQEGVGCWENISSSKLSSFPGSRVLVEGPSSELDSGVLMGFTGVLRLLPVITWLRSNLLSSAASRFPRLVCVVFTN